MLDGLRANYDRFRSDSSFRRTVLSALLPATFVLTISGLSTVFSVSTINSRNEYLVQHPLPTATPTPPVVYGDGYELDYLGEREIAISSSSDQGLFEGKVRMRIACGEPVLVQDDQHAALPLVTRTSRVFLANDLADCFPQLSKKG